MSNNLTRRLTELTERYNSTNAHDLLVAGILTEFPRQIAVVSSFGAESAVLLHMVAAINPDTDVIFLDTGKHFDETIRYRDALVSLLGLTHAHTVSPDASAVAERDARSMLWSENPDQCCELRKVEPLANALAPFAAWISGRKSHQSAERRDLPKVEYVDGKFKFNPLALWSRLELVSYLERHGLPRHPLEADGYVSIGCIPCTDRLLPGEDSRAGRWRGRNKTECGIHRSPQHRATS